MKNIWGDNIPAGYYLASNGQVYKSKRESVIDRTTKVGAASALGIQPPPQKSTYRGKFQWPDSFEVIPAPTSNKSDKPDKRDRAIECGYNEENEVLVIIFRTPVKSKRHGSGVYEVAKDDNGLPLAPPIIKYPDVPVEMWEQLKLSDSTGRWLRYSGVDFIGYEKTTMQSLRNMYP
jgi:hypothetical protein